MIKAVFIVVLLVFAFCLPQADKVSAPPGMHDATIYSGFLETSKTGRKMHYVFVEATVQDPKSVPLAIWLNGGPGCSSLMGMLQEVGPYTIGNNYTQGDLLTKNPYGWSNAANMLFLQSPSIVGFSTEESTTYQWTDQETAADAMAAIKDFLFTKAPQFSDRSLFITGESYAGKYIPDITTLILGNNRDEKNKYINIKGIMVGNGVMSFIDNSLEKSSIDYMISHDTVSDRIRYIYQNACGKDFKSPRCRFAKYEIGYLKIFLNHYNIYETCHQTAQGMRLRDALAHPFAKYSETHIYREEGQGLQEIPDCPSDRGAINYWNLNKYAYHVQNISKHWSVCAYLNYSITQRGSMDEYRQIFTNGALRVWLYSGDFDDVVPFTDTEKNADQLFRSKAGEWTSWNVKEQHAGFFQAYDQNLTVITVKAAGHMVPQNQPKAAYQLFYNFVNGKGVNNQIY